MQSYERSYYFWSMCFWTNLSFSHVIQLCFILIKKREKCGSYLSLEVPEHCKNMGKVNEISFSAKCSFLNSKLFREVFLRQKNFSFCWWSKRDGKKCIILKCSGWLIKKSVKKRKIKLLSNEMPPGLSFNSTGDS